MPLMNDNYSEQTCERVSARLLRSERITLIKT